MGLFTPKIMEPPNGFEPLTCCLRISQRLYLGVIQAPPLHTITNDFPTIQTSAHNQGTPRTRVDTLSKARQKERHLYITLSLVLLACVGVGRFSIVEGVRLGESLFGWWYTHDGLISFRKLMSVTSNVTIRY